MARLNLTGKKPVVSSGPPRPMEDVIRDYASVMSGRTGTIHLRKGSTASTDQHPVKLANMLRGVYGYVVKYVYVTPSQKGKLKS